MSLDMANWKEFRFGDLITDIYKAKAINKDDLTVATDNLNVIRYITRTGENNGCELLADVRDIDADLIEKGNAISIGDTTATCFYQEEEFITGDHMVVVRADSWLNTYTALYIVAILTKEKYKYSYGRAFLMDRIKETVVKLPADKHGNPDWQSMEDYIKKLHHKPLTTGVKKSQCELNNNNWKQFKVSSILSILNGKGITTEEIEENPGDFTVVQSGEENNGVLGKISLSYCKSVGYTYSEKECLTVARSGSAGFVSFQKHGCVVGDSAKILLLDESVANTYVYLFIRTVLMANKYKYAYGRKVTETKYMDDYIELPAKQIDGEYVPDWGYMENYMKSLPYGDRL